MVCKKEDNRSIYTIKKTLKKNLYKRAEMPNNLLNYDNIPLFTDIINDAVYRNSIIVNEAWLFSNILILNIINKNIILPDINIIFLILYFVLFLLIKI
jgi:hypothetical protein